MLLNAEYLGLLYTETGRSTGRKKSKPREDSRKTSRVMEVKIPSLTGLEITRTRIF
jgi:hypothetical protein